MNTETIDMLFLELSQFTTATTKREIELRKLNAELLAALEKACTSDIKDKCKWIDEAETAMAKAEKLR